MKTVRSNMAEAVLLLAASCPVVMAADTASPAGGVATLGVAYELEGSGTFASTDKVLKREWQVKDRYEVLVRLRAHTPGGFPAFHAADAGQQQAQAAQMVHAERAVDAMAPMMADAMKIMQLCGDDEACITRETMKMAQGVDVNSPALKGARADIKAASAMPDARYQLFEPAGMTGTFSLDERLKEADRDPICMRHPAATCHLEATLKATGDITLEGKTDMPGGTMLEVDLAKATLGFNLPLPYPVQAEEIVQSDKPDTFSGSRETYRFLTDLKLDLKVTHACGASCASASGVKSWDVVDQMSGQPARLTARWTFRRQ